MGSPRGNGSVTPDGATTQRDPAKPGGTTGAGAPRGAGRSSDDAVQAVAGVTEAGDDVAVVVQPLVHRPGHHGDRHVQVGDGGLEPLDALGRGQQADGGDVVGAEVDQVADSHGEGAAGRQHRVQQVDLAPGQVVGQP